jgi:hypothetical protein
MSGAMLLARAGITSPWEGFEPKQSNLDPATNGRAKITLQTLKSPAGFAKPAHRGVCAEFRKPAWARMSTSVDISSVRKAGMFSPGWPLRTG